MNKIIPELLRWERRLSGLTQVAIRDPEIEKPSETLREITQIRDNLRKRIRKFGYKGYF